MGLITDARDIDMEAESEEQRRLDAAYEKAKRKQAVNDLEDPNEERSALVKRQKKQEAQAAAEKKAWDDEYVKRLKQNEQA